MDKSADNVIQLEEFCEALMQLDLQSTLLQKSDSGISQAQAWIEIFIFRSRFYRKGLMLFVIIPQLWIASLYGLVYNNKTLDYTLITFYCINFLDFLIRLVVYGTHRYFNYHYAPTPQSKVIFNRWYFVA